MIYRFFDCKCYNGKFTEKLGWGGGNVCVFKVSICAPNEKICRLVKGALHGRQILDQQATTSRAMYSAL